MFRRLRLYVLMVVVGMAATAAPLTLTSWRDGTEPPRPNAVETSPVVLDHKGRLLRPFTIADGRWRLPVNLDMIDPVLIKMLIAYEDRRFREHSGIDGLALTRAFWQAAASGRLISGASTLTMQVARLIDERPTRSWSAKIRQIRRAVTIEKHLSKEDILTLYFMRAPYGGNIEGVRAASIAYFGKEPKRLTTAQAALLVALPQAPEARRPDRDPKAARLARDRVLDRMRRDGILTAEEAMAAKREDVPDTRKPFPILAGHTARRAREAEPMASEIHLTIDRDSQRELQYLARDRARTIGPSASVAILVAEHETGRIVASIGSADFLDDSRLGHVDMIHAVRSPGSTLKPFIYGLAFEAGLAHPESLIDDRPTGFSGYAPTNFDKTFQGRVSVRAALQQSLNVPAVALLEMIGPSRLIGRIRRARVSPTIPGHLPPSLAIGLGGFGVSLHDLVSIYAALARGGVPVTLHDDLRQRGAVVTQQPMLEPVPAWYVTDILAGAPPPTAAQRGAIAYKTGTSYGYRDAWSVGFDGKHVIGVWVGRANGAPMPGITGIKTAAPILFEAFARVDVKRTPLRPAPRGVLNVTNVKLPPPLRQVKNPNMSMTAHSTGPEIAYPPNGAAVELGFTGNRAGAMPLVVKIRDGRPPFAVMANGYPIALSPHARSASWRPEGPGFVDISVVDAEGRSDRVEVFVE